MKINILSNLVETPTGGGNQFLKALRKAFIKKSVYVDDPYEADIVIFNSFNFLVDKLFFKLLDLKKKGKILVHRVDGPISLYRGKDLELDKIIYGINNQIADATVFQSNWSKNANYSLGMKKKDYEAVIINAPDGDIFNTNNRIDFSKDRRIRLVSASWSSNINKGFDTYKWLDENLDFDKYEYTFIGNSPFKFKNIKHIPPLNSLELAKELKSSDIYITASKKDPCSNSLIESLHCALPSVVLNDGGHPEIIGKGGEVFNNKEEIPLLLSKITDNYSKYQKSISVKSIEIVADEYIAFCLQVNDKVDKNQSSFFYNYRFLYEYYLWRIKGKLSVFSGNIKRLFDDKS